MNVDIHEMLEIEDPKKLLKKLIEWDSEETRRYKLLHKEWEKNVLFYLGKHWLEETMSDSTFDGWRVLEADDNNPRPVTNYVALWCDYKRSQILGKRVRPVVKPASMNKDDYDSAQLGTLALRALHIIDDEDALQNLNFLHAELFGISFRTTYKAVVPNRSYKFPSVVKVKTDFSMCLDCMNIQEQPGPCAACGGETMQTSEESEEQEMDEEGNPVMLEIPTFTVRTEVLDPFGIKMAFRGSSRQLQWISHSTLQSAKWVEENYSVNAEGYIPPIPGSIKPAESIPRALIISDRLAKSVGIGHSSLRRDVAKGSTSNIEEERNCVFRKSYFEPCEGYPNGVLICWTDSGVVYKGDPDVPIVRQKGQLPRWNSFTWQNYKIHPLRPEGIAYVEDLIPINKTINSLDAIIIKHADKSANPERVVYSGSIQNNDDNTGGDTVIKSDPTLPNGGAPQYLQHPQLPNEFYRLRNEKVTEGEKLAKVNEIVQGLHPAGVDTYRGMQLLKDAADSGETDLYNATFQFFRDTAQLKLITLQDCLRESNPDLEEMMQIVSQNENYGTLEVQDFLGSDLRQNFNVVMEEVDYGAQSKAAEADKLSGFLTQGLLTPEDLHDPVSKIRMLRKFGITGYCLPGQADVEKAERFIQYIENGEADKILPTPPTPPMPSPIPGLPPTPGNPGSPGLVQPFDDFQIMLRVLTNWMKSSQYESLPRDIQQGAEKVLQLIEQRFTMVQTSQGNPDVGQQQPVPDAPRQEL